MQSKYQVCSCWPLLGRVAPWLPDLRPGPNPTLFWVQARPGRSCGSSHPRPSRRKTPVNLRTGSQRASWSMCKRNN